MATPDECRCCQERHRITEFMQELDGETPQCITQHPGFDPVCLNVWSLRNAYLEYKTKYEHYNEQTHERYRYTAYRELVRMCWGYIGKHIRLTLPACAVMRIRNTFPSESYTGFRYPNLGTN